MIDTERGIRERTTQLRTSTRPNAPLIFPGEGPTHPREALLYFIIAVIFTYINLYFAGTPCPTLGTAIPLDIDPADLDLGDREWKQDCVSPSVGDTALEAVPVYRVGFFMIATGSLYSTLAQQLHVSMERFFCADARRSRIVYVHYFIWTDDERWKPKHASRFRETTKVFHKRLGWPGDTLMRFELIINHKDTYNYTSYDYLYYIDADMKFVDHVCEDIFGLRVATAHPHFPLGGHKGNPYDENTKSKAYIEKSLEKENQYYVGAFWGGKASEVINLLQSCRDGIQWDFNNLDGYIARVHDESHVNRYFIDHKPTVLTSSYCYPQPPSDFVTPWLSDFEKKILSVNKPQGWRNKGSASEDDLAKLDLKGEARTTNKRNSTTSEESPSEKG
mmetsp:Transcript_4871/g.7599  ORF Transcript_4871/g.7599 Transcript_4871/m.7599 type:complete len:390 (-) Transcript_4871:111-1280(-)